ncbi:MAG: hypothetical protein ACR2RB_21255 [Gammaproteobacteria bacterium]
MLCGTHVQSGRAALTWAAFGVDGLFQAAVAVIFVGPTVAEGIDDFGELLARVAVFHAPWGGVVVHRDQPIAFVFVFVPQHLGAVVVEDAAALAGDVVGEAHFDVVAIAEAREFAFGVVFDPVAFAVLPAKARVGAADQFAFVEDEYIRAGEAAMVVVEVRSIVLTAPPAALYSISRLFQGDHSECTVRLRAYSP